MEAPNDWNDKLKYLIPDQSPPSTTIALATCSFVACAILILPLTLKIRARNIPLSTILASVLIYTLVRGINALVWPRFDVHNWDGQGLCDVEVKLLPACEVAASGGLLCLFRQLSRTMKSSRLGVSPSSTQKLRTRLFDVFFCIVLPILSMPASFVVQPGRFAIVPVQGCSTVYYPTLLSYFLLLGWPMAISLFAMVYAGLATVRMITHYGQLSHMFADLPQGSRMKGEIIRTYIFACIVYLIRFPLMLYSLFIRNRLSTLQPFSWSEIHPVGWSGRISYPLVSRKYEYIFGFASVLFALLAVGCFGVGQDTKERLKGYGAWLKSNTKRSKIKEGLV